MYVAGLYITTCVIGLCASPVTQLSNHEWSNIAAEDNEALVGLYSVSCVVYVVANVDSRVDDEFCIELIVDVLLKT